MKVSYLLGLFTEKYPNKVFLSMVLGVLSGLSYAGLIPLVMISLESYVPELFSDKIATISGVVADSPNMNLFILYCVLCIFILVAGALSRILVEHVRAEVESDLRLNFYARIRSSSLQALEKNGSHNLLAALTKDIPMIAEAALVFPALVTQLATTIGLLAFIAYLSWKMFAFVVFAIISGIVIHALPLLIGVKLFARSRALFGQLMQSMKGLVYGAKELKLNALRSNEFHKENLHDCEMDLRRSNKQAIVALSIAGSLGNLISFFAIGLICFFLVYVFSINAKDLMAIVMAMLYMTGPVAQILNHIQEIGKASVPINLYRETLKSLESEFQAEQSGQSIIDKPASDWRQFQIRDLQYKYQYSGMDEHFHIGPIDLDINRGDITFIVGGNGSGKTTLGKLLSMLYLPESGLLMFDGKEVNDRNRDSYRQFVSAIYSDFFLFNKLYGLSGLNEQAQGYLRDLGLDEKVRIVDGEFSSTALSDGQRKRLSLLVAYLEDRDLYIFDEWAADQDPEFKNLFYKNILVDLKKRNKAVICISHDDRYFNIADKIVRLDNGKISSIETGAGTNS